MREEVGDTDADMHRCGSAAVHNPDIVPGGLVVLMLWYIAFIAYVMVFALSQVGLRDRPRNQKAKPRVLPAR